MDLGSSHRTTAEPHSVAHKSLSPQPSQRLDVSCGTDGRPTPSSNGATAVMALTGSEAVSNAFVAFHNRRIQEQQQQQPGLSQRDPSSPRAERAIPPHHPDGQAAQASPRMPRNISDGLRDEFSGGLQATRGLPRDSRGSRGARGAGRGGRGGLQIMQAHAASQGYGALPHRGASPARGRGGVLDRTSTLNQPDTVDSANYRGDPPSNRGTFNDGSSRTGSSGRGQGNSRGGSSRGSEVPSRGVSERGYAGRGRGVGNSSYRGHASGDDGGFRGRGRGRRELRFDPEFSREDPVAANGDSGAGRGNGKTTQRQLYDAGTSYRSPRPAHATVPSAAKSEANEPPAATPEREPSEHTQQDEQKPDMGDTASGSQPAGASAAFSDRDRNDDASESASSVAHPRKPLPGIIETGINMRPAKKKRGKERRRDEDGSVRHGEGRERDTGRRERTVSDLATMHGDEVYRRSGAGQPSTTSFDANGRTASYHLNEGNTASYADYRDHADGRGLWTPTDAYHLAHDSVDIHVSGLHDRYRLHSPADAYVMNTQAPSSGAAYGLSHQWTAPRHTRVAGHETRGHGSTFSHGGGAASRYQHGFDRPTHYQPSANETPIPHSPEPATGQFTQGRQRGYGNPNRLSNDYERGSAPSAIANGAVPDFYGSPDLESHCAHSGPAVSSSEAYLQSLQSQYSYIVDLENSLPRTNINVASLSGAAQDHLELLLSYIRPHRYLADAYIDFIRRCVCTDPAASLQSLVQKYDISSRLWQNGFNQVLHNILEEILPNTESAPPADEVVDLVRDYIYDGYNFITHLLEEPVFESYTDTWYECLGDLSRYRMRVAAIQAFNKPNGAAAVAVTKPAATAASRASLFNDEKRTGPGILLRGKSKGKPLGVTGQLSNYDDFEDVQTPGNSIGAAAINSWDLHEEATWRMAARDWYNKCLIVSPGTGRVYRILAELAQGDPLRQLYYLAKGVSTSHPDAGGEAALDAYMSSMTSALPDEPGQQWPRVIFIHVHALLISRAASDEVASFSKTLLLRLDESYDKLQREYQKPTSQQKLDSSEMRNARMDHDSVWAMFAIVNLSSILDYGRPDSTLKTALSSKRGAGGNPQSMASARQSWPRPEAAVAAATHAMQDLAIHGETSMAESTDLDQSIEFACTLFRHTCDRMWKPCGTDRALNPYLTIFLTFLGSVLQVPAVKRVVEPHLPWEAILSTINAIPASARGTLADQSSKLFGTPLPEDWCIRGMDWTGRQLFGRGYWRSKFSTGAVYQSADDINASLMPESEADVLDDAFEGPSMPAHAGGPVEANVVSTQTGGDEQDARTGRDTLGMLRWKRVALMATWISRACPQLRIELATGKASLDLSFASSATGNIVSRNQGNGSIDDVSLGTPSSHWNGRATDGNDGGRGRGITPVAIVPGWTTLLFDTNVVMTDLDTFKRFSESSTWHIVLPLIVVTELEGLKAQTGGVGESASAALTYLEGATAAPGNMVKLQTSRGNYLRDLTLRFEDVDFGSSASRTVDDAIVQTAVWQKEHWMDRRSLFKSVGAADRTARVASHTSKVVLVSNDRTLRLKGRAKGVTVADVRSIEHAAQLAPNG